MRTTKERTISTRQCGHEYTHPLPETLDEAKALLTEAEMLSGACWVLSMKARTEHSKTCPVIVKQKEEMNEALRKTFETLFHNLEKPPEGEAPNED